MGFGKALGDLVMAPVKLVVGIVATVITCGGSVITCGGIAVCATGLAIACAPCFLCNDCDEVMKILDEETKKVRTGRLRSSTTRWTQTSIT
jgi:hypothetical protein